MYEVVFCCGFLYISVLFPFSNWAGSFIIILVIKKIILFWIICLKISAHCYLDGACANVLCQTKAENSFS